MTYEYHDPAKLPIALYIRAEDEPDRYSSPPGLYRLTITAAPLLLRPDGTPQNPDDADPRGLADLRAEIRLYQDSAGPGWWSIEYRSPFTVDARRAQIMARTFRALDAYNRRHEARHGYPIDAAAYILRLGAALRARYIIDAPNRGPHGGSYDAADYVELDAPTAAAHIRRRVTEWTAAHPKPAPEPTATQQTEPAA